MGDSTEASTLAVAGVRLAAVAAGIREDSPRKDLVLIALDEGTEVAAVFTRNAFAAAPVELAREHLAMASPRVLIVNSGNANAGTGSEGLEAARRCCQAVAGIAGLEAREILPFSTGVIGESLPVERIVEALPGAWQGLSTDGWQTAAEAIMTTDTVAKLVSRTIEIDGRPVRLTGMAKGSGMIRPDMATMLAYIATDAAIEPVILRAMLDRAVAGSFNAITVDGDTSTNDACVLMATGRSGLPPIHSLDEAAADAVQAALNEVCEALARAIVRDGEGATKFITLLVEEGEDIESCRRLAYTVAHSPLVKTAFFASDPNWGRILAAVGRAGLPDLDISAVRIWLDEVCIVSAGGRDPGYTEAQGQDVMSRDEITVRIALGRGQACCRIWTCDLSYDYVRINAEYRS